MEVMTGDKACGLGQVAISSENVVLWDFDNEAAACNPAPRCLWYLVAIT